MSKWLDRLRAHEKNRRLAQNGTDKTDKSQTEGVLSVLSVRSEQVSANFSDELNDEVAAIEERAAILEYDCGLSRDEAERLARTQISNTVH